MLRLELLLCSYHPIKKCVLTGKAVLIKGGKRKVEKPEPKTSAAKRRMKLFEDAEFYGAQIVTNSKWIAAINRDFDQAHCFGRGKPKVKPGTNDIDPELNLRDDEGISEESKKLRDSSLAYVKDGIGFDDQPFEAGWCVMGGNPMYSGSTLAWGPDLEPCDSYKHVNLYCRAKKAGEVCPLITFLELDTGKLFITNAAFEGLFGQGMMDLGQNWAIDDFNNERNGYNEGGISKRINSDPSFADICQKAVEASLKGLTDAPAINVVESAKKHQQNKLNHYWYSSGISILKFYIAVYDQLIEKKLKPIDIPIVLSYKGNYYKIKSMKEGKNSCLVFDVKG